MGVSSCLQQEMRINYGPRPVISAQQSPHQLLEVNPALMSTCQPKHKRPGDAGGKGRARPHPSALMLGTGHFPCHHRAKHGQVTDSGSPLMSFPREKTTHYREKGPTEQPLQRHLPVTLIPEKALPRGGLKPHQMLLQPSTTHSCSPPNFSRHEMKACRKSGG